MGRPPCCDKTIGVKKGPWTPEEDIILVSYIQENGPGNWKVVPTKTGLVRCSKSCRLRWTNYLRPGIRRGNFTEQEEKLIIHLQALLGNRWAAIASYLPERTDNDIKNYWNTHLRKKLKKPQGDGGGDGPKNKAGYSRGQWERRLQTDINMAKQALCEALSFDQYSTASSDLTMADVNSTGFSACHQPPSHGPSSATYASSADNISRLLEGWMRNSPTPGGKTAMEQANSNSSQQSSTSLTSPEPHESRLVLDSSSPEDSDTSNIFHEEGKPKLEEAEVHFSMLEEWLFDDSNVDMSLVDYTHGMF